MKKKQDVFLLSEWLSHPLVKRFFNYIFTIKQPVKKERFFIELIIFILLVIWSLDFLAISPSETNHVNWIYGFLDKVNLAFHEAGHIFLMWAGTFMHAFGGTLLQCLIPLIIMRQFLKQKDNYEASLIFWWLGQNFIDISIYIYDAKARTLPLLGGITGQENPETHDWYVLLNLMNSLDNYAVIAGTVNTFGKFFIILSLIWMGKILYKKFVYLKTHQQS